MEHKIEWHGVAPKADEAAKARQKLEIMTSGGVSDDSRPKQHVRHSAKSLAKLGEKHPEIVVLDADLAKSTKSELFAKKFPERFFEMGIAEANMIGTAAGLVVHRQASFPLQLRLLSSPAATTRFA